MTATDSWIVRAHQNPRALMRLFCFPYSGGSSAIFWNWATKLPARVESCAVELPGHGRRLAEPLIDEMSSLVDATVAALLPHIDRPFAIFGHSMGALVGFEISRQLRRHHGMQPQCLLVSGHVAPQLNDPSDPLHDLPKAEFVERVRELGGTPDEALQNEELRDIILPILRADFKVCETYVCAEDEPLDCSITAFGGLDDEYVRRVDLEAWGEQTRGPFSVRMFPGDHFFINTSAELVVQAVADILSGFSKPLETD